MTPKFNSGQGLVIKAAGRTLGNRGRRPSRVLGSVRFFTLIYLIMFLENLFLLCLYNKLSARARASSWYHLFVPGFFPSLFSRNLYHVCFQGNLGRNNKGRHYNGLLVD